MNLSSGCCLRLAKAEGPLAAPGETGCGTRAADVAIEQTDGQERGEQASAIGADGMAEDTDGEEGGGVASESRADGNVAVGEAEATDEDDEEGLERRLVRLERRRDAFPVMPGEVAAVSREFSAINPDGTTFWNERVESEDLDWQQQDLGDCLQLRLPKAPLTGSANSLNTMN